MSMSDVNTALSSTIKELEQQIDELYGEATESINAALAEYNRDRNKNPDFGDIADPVYSEELSATQYIPETLEKLKAKLEQANDEEPSEQILLLQEVEAELEPAQADFEQHFGSSFTRALLKNDSDDNLF